jgi:hypothetical protein
VPPDFRRSFGELQGDKPLSSVPRNMDSAGELLTQEPACPRPAFLGSGLASCDAPRNDTN